MTNREDGIFEIPVTLRVLISTSSRGNSAHVSGVVHITVNDLVFARTKFSVTLQRLRRVPGITSEIRVARFSRDESPGARLAEGINKATDSTGIRYPRERRAFPLLRRRKSRRWAKIGGRGAAGRASAARSRAMEMTDVTR